MGSLVSGFLLGFSLILAIGSQNAFVLRAGLARKFVLPIVLTCAVSDAVLIIAGVSGLGALISQMPDLITAIRYFGATFLVFYGVRSWKAALRATDGLTADGVLNTQRQAIVTCLMFTWLNPHVYLDTVVLLGSISQTHASPLLFAVGATLASFVFFFSLGFGARLLAPLFAAPRAWQILDVVIGIIMFSLAYMLIAGA
jgi:L-lysine exporter family protein LysE/ArgO